MSLNPIGNSAVNGFTQPASADAEFMTMINQLRQTDPQKANMLMFQRAQEKQQELISFISNVMKKMNEMNMAIINNLR